MYFEVPFLYRCSVFNNNKFILVCRWKNWLSADLQMAWIYIFSIEDTVFIFETCSFWENLGTLTIQCNPYQSLNMIRHSIQNGTIFIPFSFFLSTVLKAIKELCLLVSFIYFLFWLFKRQETTTPFYLCITLWYTRYFVGSLCFFVSWSLITTKNSRVEIQ